jgi:transcription-repair coupling factor (superfamily II helicase)
LNVTANIAQNYVARGEERMDLYRRMAAIRCQADADDLLDEIIDRYGDPPRGVLNLIDIALLRAEARSCGVQDIRQKASELMVTLSSLNFEAVSAICADPDYQNRLFFVATAKLPTLRLKLHNGTDSLKQAKVFIARLKSCCQM